MTFSESESGSPPLLREERRTDSFPVGESDDRTHSDLHFCDRVRSESGSCRTGESDGPIGLAQRTRGHVRIMLGPLDARVYGIRYADRHIIKYLPSHDRRWSRPLGCWITPTHVVDDVREWLECAGYTVALVDVSNPPTRTALRPVAIPPETSR